MKNVDLIPQFSAVNKSLIQLKLMPQKKKAITWLIVLARQRNSQPLFLVV